MEAALSLAEMRKQQQDIAAVGPNLRVLGLLYCQACGCRRAFVSRDAHCQHVTDAACETCSFSYGRVDIPEVRRGEVVDGVAKTVIHQARRRSPVITDEQAAAAALAWREAVAGRHADPAAELPRPAPRMPAEDETRDGSRVSSYLKSLDKSVVK